MENENSKAFDSWAIPELMGHRRLAGKLSEQTIGGAAFLRLDIPEMDGKPGFTQFYSGASVYCITPRGEELAREVAKGIVDHPVQPFDVRHLLPAGNGERAPVTGRPAWASDSGADHSEAGDAEDLPFQRLTSLKRGAR